MAHQDEEDDDDYMSDTFLNTQYVLHKILAQIILLSMCYYWCSWFFFYIRTTKDVRPGLLMTHEQQRVHSQMKKRKESELLHKATSIKVLEEQRRQEGLEKAIDSNNKGFSLLQKMGYKPGLGIGKNS